MGPGSLELLEYASLKEIVGRHISSAAARRLLDELAPSTDRAALEAALPHPQSPAKLTLAPRIVAKPRNKPRRNFIAVSSKKTNLVGHSAGTTQGGL